MNVIISRKKIKNVYIRVKKNGDVNVSAPMKIDEKEIFALVNKNSNWILKKIEEYQNKTDISPDLSEDELVSAKEILTKTFIKIKNKLNILNIELKLKKYKSKWGVCNVTNRIVTLNTKLIRTNKRIIEYVIIHELMHLYHPNHSRDFYNAVGEHLPDYKEVIKLLRNYKL